MKKIKKLWEKLNKYILYISVAFIFVFQIVELTFPGVLELYSSKAYLAAISAILFILFDHIISLESLCQTTTDLQSSPRFSDGMSDIINKYEEINCLDIFSHTSMVHYQYIYDRHIKIHNLRLLVLNPDRNESYFSLNRNEEKRFSDETKLAISYWENLKNQGLIDNLSIRYYDFYPSFYFSIVNKSNIHWGLFSLQKVVPSTSLLSHHTICSKSFDTNSLIFDFQEFFNKIYDISISL